MRVGVAGRVGLRRAESCCACLRGAPRLRGRRRDRRAPRRRAGRRARARRSPRPTRGLAFAADGAAALSRLRARLRGAAPRPLRPARRRRSGGRRDRRRPRRGPAASATRRRGRPGTGRPTPRRSSLGTAVYGLVERHRDELKGADDSWRCPGATRPRRCSRSARSSTRASRRAKAIVVDAMSGASGAGSALERHAALPGPRSATPTPTGSSTHRHTAEMEQELASTVVLHAAPRPDRPRAARHLHARPPRRARTPKTPSRRCTTPTTTSRSSS